MPSTRDPPTGGPISARTATFRTSCLRSVTPAGARRAPIWRAGSCSGTSWARPNQQTRPSSSHDMAVDLLVFGPHPDDIEIGRGGVVARHAALGFSVGL